MRRARRRRARPLPRQRRARRSGRRCRSPPPQVPSQRPGRQRISVTQPLRAGPPSGTAAGPSGPLFSQADCLRHTRERAAAFVLNGQLALHLLCTGRAGARAAGTGPFAAVGFSYGGGGGGGGSDSGGSDASGSDDSGSESDGDAGAGGAGDDADGLAANLGIDDFSALLRRAEREEAATALGQKPRKKCASAAPPPCLPCRLPGCPARPRRRAPPAPRWAPAGARGRREQAGCRAGGVQGSGLQRASPSHKRSRWQGGRRSAALPRRGRRGKPW